MFPQEPAMVARLHSELVAPLAGLYVGQWVGIVLGLGLIGGAGLGSFLGPWKCVR